MNIYTRLMGKGGYCKDEKTHFLYVFIVVGVAVHFPGLRIYAEGAVPDEIDMENEAYEEHRRDIVVFSHNNHSETYAEAQPEFFEAGCGECHHDEKNNPLQLKPGEDVKGCIECHANPGSMPSKEKKDQEAEPGNRLSGF